MSTKALQDLLYRARHGIATTGERLDAAAKELEAIEKAAMYAAYGRIPGVPEEQKHFMNTMLAIADEAKERES